MGDVSECGRGGGRRCVSVGPGSVLAGECTEIRASPGRDVIAMKCDKCIENLSEYLDGKMDAARRRAVREHLAGCAHCRAELSRIEKLVGALGNLPRVAVPDDVAASVRAAIEREATLSAREELASSGEPAPQRSGTAAPEHVGVLGFVLRWRWALVNAAAIAACAVLAITIVFTAAPSVTSLRFAVSGAREAPYAGRVSDDRNAAMEPAALRRESERTESALSFATPSDVMAREYAGRDLRAERFAAEQSPGERRAEEIGGPASASTDVLLRAQRPDASEPLPEAFEAIEAASAAEKTDELKRQVGMGAPEEMGAELAAPELAREVTHSPTEGEPADVPYRQAPEAGLRIGDAGKELGEEVAASAKASALTRDVLAKKDVVDALQAGQVLTLTLPTHDVENTVERLSRLARSLGLEVRKSAGNEPDIRASYMQERSHEETAAARLEFEGPAEAVVLLLMAASGCESDAPTPPAQPEAPRSPQPPLEARRGQAVRAILRVEILPQTPAERKAE